MKHDGQVLVGACCTSTCLSKPHHVHFARHLTRDAFLRGASYCLGIDLQQHHQRVACAHL